MRSPKFTYFLNHSHTLQPLKALNGTPEVTSRQLTTGCTFLALNGKGPLKMELMRTISIFNF